MIVTLSSSASFHGTAALQEYEGCVYVGGIEGKLLHCLTQLPGSRGISCPGDSRDLSPLSDRVAQAAVAQTWCGRDSDSDNDSDREGAKGPQAAVMMPSDFNLYMFQTLYCIGA